MLLIQIKIKKVGNKMSEKKLNGTVIVTYRCKGLFDTSLENEYALIGRSLEKKNYNKQYVYEWLDRIRENGNQQSFKTRYKDDT